MSSSGGTRAILAALFANLGIAVTKFIAFMLTGSSSMLAEGIHSVADSGNQVLLLVGARRARRPATPQHPFGYGRERYIYAFIVSIVLFTVGGLLALYEAWHKFNEPTGIQDWRWVPITVLVAAIVMESFSFRTAIVEADALRGGASWQAFVRHAKSPELPVILLEDLGALVGLIFAFFGVGMTLITRNGIWDAAGTAMIGILLVSIAGILAVETKSLLLGESASPRDQAAIGRAITAGADIAGIIHMRTLHLGPEELLVAAKIAVDETATASDVVRGINAAEARIRATVPIARVIYLEPDMSPASQGPVTAPAAAAVDRPLAGGGPTATGPAVSVESRGVIGTPGPTGGSR
jgi:cation diffusion facilitator family transporter